MPRRRLVFMAPRTASQVATRGRIARYKGTISRGYTRRSGFYGRGGLGELKFFDTTRATHIPAATGTISNASLCLIPQGITESNRIGRKYTIRHLEMRGDLILPTTAVAAQTGDRTRVIVYVDTQTNGVTAAAADIIEATVNINRFTNLANQGRFRILMDRVYVTKSHAGSGRGSTDTLSYAEDIVNFRFSKSLKLAIENSTVDGAITGIRSNNIGVLAIGTAAPVTGLKYEARVRFSDG